MQEKADTNAEYGKTICCHSFRLEETRFIENVIKNADQEYNADGVKKRIIISHTPFTWTINPPFDIEQDLYEYWVKLIGENIKPDFYLCGHRHICEVIQPGEEKDSFNQSCPTIVGAMPCYDDSDKFTACGISYQTGKIIVSFTNQDKEVIKETEI